jgi:hypothetical protein
MWLLERHGSRIVLPMTPQHPWFVIKEKMRGGIVGAVWFGLKLSSGSERPVLVAWLRFPAAPSLQFRLEFLLECRSDQCLLAAAT